MLYLACSDVESFICENKMCSVEHTGKVHCSPPCQFLASCQVDYRRWPYDQHDCMMILGSWLQHGEEVNLTAGLAHEMLAEYQWSTRNNMFSVVTHYTTLQTSDGSGNTTAQLKFLISLQRRSAMEALMLLTPAAVFMSMNAIAMWLEPDCAERLGLIALNLFMQMAFMQQLAFYVPLNGEHAPVIRECNVQFPHESAQKLIRMTWQSYSLRFHCGSALY